LSVSDEPHLAAAASSAEHVDQIGRKAGRGLTWSRNVLGVVALGYYLLAFNISSWVPSIVGTAVRYVSVPSFSRLVERDAETLALGVRRSVPALVAVILPAAIVMTTTATSGPRSVTWRS
jgi:hypothetical protein